MKVGKEGEVFCVERCLWLVKRPRKETECSGERCIGSEILGWVLRANVSLTCSDS